MIAKHKSVIKTALILSFVGLVIWFGIANTARINELKKQGKTYNTTAITTVEPGKPGDSAYQIAVKNGFNGTEQEWLISLIGLSGTTIQGENGLSAYQIAQLMGYDGTETEWLASLKGDQGARGRFTKGEPGNTPTCYYEPTECRGNDGTNGVDGNDGVDGEPPVSWKFTFLAVDYECERSEPFEKTNPTYKCAEVL